MNNPVAVFHARVFCAGRALHALVRRHLTRHEVSGVFATTCHVAVCLTVVHLERVVTTIAAVQRGDTLLERSSCFLRLLHQAFGDEARPLG